MLQRHKIFAPVIVTIFLLVFAYTAYAEEGAEAGSLAPVFWRSEYLGASGGTYANDWSDPLNIFFLPHASASAQRPTVSGSGGVALDGSAGGGSIGVLFPARRGVLGAATGVYSDDGGALWRGDVGAGRPLGYRLDGGASVTVQAGMDGSDGDFGIGLNLSGSYRPDFGKNTDVVVYGGMRNIGKSVRFGSDSIPPFPAFTPFGGLTLSAISIDPMKIDLSAAISLESFQTLRLDGSIVSRFSGGVWGVIGWSHRFGVGRDGVWPGISIGFGIPVGNGVSGREKNTKVHLTGQPDRQGRLNLSGGFSTVLPSVDTQPPRIEISVISPEVFRDDGAGTIFLSSQSESREILVDVVMKDDQSVVELACRLTGPDGKVVREWSFSPRGSNSPKGGVSERLSSFLYRTELSGRILWTSDLAEKDGFYRLEVTGQDGGENRAVPIYLDILVDTRSPELNIVETGVQKNEADSSEPRKTDDHVLRLNHKFRTLFEVRDAERIAAFLMDEAGRKMFPLEIGISGSANEEGFLTGEVLWNGSAPEEARVTSGAYRISIEATDFLNNRSSVISDAVIVEQESPSFQIVLSDDRVAPNGNGHRDRVIARASLNPVEGLREWSITVTDTGTGKITGSWSGIDLPPKEIVLDRNVFPVDGVYEISGRSVYENGTETSVSAGKVYSDRTAPSVELALSRQTVRPEQGRDVEIYFEAGSGIARASLLVEQVGRDDGIAPFTLAEFERLPDTFIWSLTGNQGQLLPPGMYRVRAEVADETGNRAVSQERDVVLLERLAGVGVVPLRRLFGPSGNGVFDVVTLLLEGPPDENGEFLVTLENESSEVIRIFRGFLPLPERIIWDGRNDRGLVVPDGRYRPTLSVSIPDVDTKESRGDWITVDTNPPSASVALSGPRIVSPDGDGVQDELLFTFQVTGNERWDRLKRRFLVYSWKDGPTRVPVQTASVNLEPGENSWIPRNFDGSALPDGRYSVAVELEDEAGNSALFESEEFIVDTRPVTAFVRVNRGAVNPDGVAPFDSVSITPVVSDLEGLVEWQLRIINDVGGISVFETEGDSQKQPKPVRWPAVDRIADISDGTYFARFEAEYHHGPRLLRESPRFRVDSTGPEISVSVDPQPFSPDGDGIDDIVTFHVTVTDNSPIQYWYLEMYDSRGAFFYDVGGDGQPPESIRWDGMARNGETVLSAEKYPWRLEVSDILGNVTVAEDVLRVDILVEPYNGGYRIQVPSITFPPNSADLQPDNDDQTTRNNRDVLDRVTEILSRFPEYAIIVEGHAVNLSGTQREESEELRPLSQRRAEAVREELIRRGVPSGMVSARGRGGTLPVVPHTDEQMRWKNRRVDFILQR